MLLHAGGIWDVRCRHMINATEWEAHLQRIRDVKSSEELSAVEHEIFGRKAGAMTLALKALQTLPLWAEESGMRRQLIRKEIQQ